MNMESIYYEALEPPSNQRIFGHGDKEINEAHDRRAYGMLPNAPYARVNANYLKMQNQLNVNHVEVLPNAHAIRQWLK